MPDALEPLILLVEDDPNLGSTLSERLGRNRYRVRWARSLREARRELALEPAALALVDVGLPDGSGFDLAEEISRQHPATAVVFLTARGEPQHRVHGLELGAEDYVVKPFHLEELLLRIENSLRRRRHWASVEDPLRIGQATIHFAELKAVRGGTVTPLSPRESSLLRLLAAQRGRVVHRDEILDEVWSRDEYPTPRTVDNFIMRLRRLVEADPEKPEVIRTIRGVGYQLAATPSSPS